MNANAALGQARAARLEQSGGINTSTTIISSSIPNAQAHANPVEVFTARCEARALLFANGEMSLRDAVDELQNAAVGHGLIDLIGQDAVQAIMGAAFAAVRLPVGPVMPEPDEVMTSGYRTPKSTIDAFWYVVGLNNPDRLKAWLRQHPGDAPTLLKLLESKL
jgi:hypothetical protein